MAWFPQEQMEGRQEQNSVKLFVTQAKKCRFHRNFTKSHGVLGIIEGVNNSPWPLWPRIVYVKLSVCVECSVNNLSVWKTATEEDLRETPAAGWSCWGCRGLKTQREQRETYMQVNRAYTGVEILLQDSESTEDMKILHYKAVRDISGCQR